MYQYPQPLTALNAQCFNSILFRSSSPFALRFRTQSCDEPSEWCYTFDFTVSNGGFIKPLSNYGEYQAGVGWAGTYAAPMSVEALYITRAISPDTTITSVTMTYTKTAGGSTNNVNRLYARRDGVIQLQNVNNQLGTNLEKEAVGNAVCDEIYIDINQGALGGTVLVTRIEVRGTGINPFGADNCA